MFGVFVRGEAVFETDLVQLQICWPAWAKIFFSQIGLNSS